VRVVILEELRLQHLVPGGNGRRGEDIFLAGRHPTYVNVALLQPRLDRRQGCGIGSNCTNLLKSHPLPI